MIIGTSVFILSTTVMVHFLVDTPGSATSGVDEQAMHNRATNALGVLVASTGYSPSWALSGVDADKVTRLGLAEAEGSIRINATKFDALAAGNLTNPSSSNGFVDYSEAVEALGLRGFDFHIRAAPAPGAFPTASWGVEGMETFRVGYVGHYVGTEQDESKSERYHLASLPIVFQNSTRVSLVGSGSAFPDDAASVRSLLLPLLGGDPVSTVVQGPADTRVFRVVNASTYESLFLQNLRSGLTSALALTNATVNGRDDLNYTSNSEVRVVLGSANLQGLSSATLSWNEYVDTDKDAGNPDSGDYGFAEVSPNGGLTWYRLTDSPGLQSTDPLVPTQTWAARNVVITSLNCAPCLGASEVQIAFHWVGDRDSASAPFPDARGWGWIIDDVSLAPTATTGFVKTFERPEFDVLVIGSNVDVSSFGSKEAMNAFRDFVAVYGGRLIVLGGENDLSWLAPTLTLGNRGGSAAVTTPDLTHPLLSIPNALDYASYGAQSAWDLGAAGYGNLFTSVLGTDAAHPILAVSNPRAYAGSQATSADEGAIILASYKPFEMPGDQPFAFFANALTFGKYHELYADVGPVVPEGIPVATATRTATMDKTRANIGSFIDMTFVIYLWPGSTTTTAQYAQGTPGQPTNLVAAPANASVALSWTAPPGTGITGYRVSMGTLHGAETYLASTAGSVTNLNVEGLTNGVTYYFTVAAENTTGAGPPSQHASATPSTEPWAPLSFTVTGAAGVNHVSWAEPWSTGGLTITGYHVYRGFSPGATTLYTTLGAVTSWDDTNATIGETVYYKIAAVSAGGEGAQTSEKSATVLSFTPDAPTSLVLTPSLNSIALSWAPPAYPGANAITSYNVYYGAASPPTTLLTSVATTSHLHSGLAQGQTVYYRVSAVNSDGEGSFSAIQSATTLAVPNQVTTFLVSNATAGAGNLSLSWTAPVVNPLAPLTGYKIYVGTTPGGQGSVAVANITDPEVVSWTHTSLSNNTTYYYTIAPTSATGDGANSSEKNATTFRAPNAPALVVATPGLSGTMNLVITPPTYNGGASVITYKVYRCAGTGCTPVTQVADTAGLTAYTDSGLTPLQKYRYAVTAVTAAGEGPKFTTGDVTAS